VPRLGDPFVVAAADRLYALWAVTLGIGLRRGEALGLRWKDVRRQLLPALSHGTCGL
jgi:integrase